MVDIRIKGISFHERVPLAYKESKKYEDKIVIYNGEKYDYMSKKVFKNDCANVKYDGRYVFLKQMFDPKNKKLLSLKETYDYFVKTADGLKEATNGKINLYKTGSKWTKAAITLFKDLEERNGIWPEKILDDEAEWIRNTMKGPLVWGLKYEGEAYSYDIVSRYPSIMLSNHFSVPIKRGKFITLTKKEFSELKFYQFGIFRVKIKNADFKLFKINELNYYTHYDLTRAKELNYEMELIEDGKPNFLLYDQYSRIQGNKIFKRFVNYLFDLKLKKVEGAKQIITSLWGTLCEKNIIKEKVQEFDIEKFEGSVIGCTPTDEEDKMMVSYYKKDSYYVHNWARLGPFLISLGRKAISRMIQPHIKYIKRIHTDGFYCSQKVEWDKPNIFSHSVCDVKMGENLGNMKYEGYCDYIKIINHNNIIGRNGKKPEFKININ